MVGGLKGGGLSDVKWDRCCFCFKWVTWVNFVWYFWCVMISSCKLLRRVCMKRWLEIDRIDWLCMSYIWLYGAGVKSIEWQQFEMNISRSLSVGISFLNFSRSFNSASVIRELVKSLRNNCKKFWFSFVAAIYKIGCSRVRFKDELNRFMIEKFWY